MCWSLEWTDLTFGEKEKMSRPIGVNRKFRMESVMKEVLWMGYEVRTLYRTCRDKDLTLVDDYLDRRGNLSPEVFHSLRQKK